MSNYRTIIDIYDRLVDISDQMHEQNDPLEKGFNACLFIMHNALKESDWINLHIENKNLSKRLETVRAMVAFPDQNIKEHLKLEDELRLEIRQLKNKLKETELPKVTGIASNELRKVEIDFEGTQIEFMSNIDQGVFTSLFMDANKYVYELKSRKKKAVRKNIIKDWYMNFYREQGFKCISINS